MKINYITFTDSGLQRKENEDFIYAFKKENCAVFLVADGMGGLTQGKNASDTLVRYVAKYIELDMDKTIELNKQLDKQYDANSFFTDLKNYLLNANKDIYENWTKNGKTSGSTLVMFAIYENTYNIFWAGDSHIYQLIDNDLVALTVDDVWENDKNRTEGMTVEQIKKDQNYGRLTNAFGSIENVNIHITNGILQKGMKFFLCSDGVYKFCKKDDLNNIILNNNQTKKQIPELIKKEIYKNGAEDNLSFIYIEIE